jgi:hypothetical protein
MFTTGRPACPAQPRLHTDPGFYDTAIDTAATVVQHVLHAVTKKRPRGPSFCNNAILAEMQQQRTAPPCISKQVHHPSAHRALCFHDACSAAVGQLHYAGRFRSQQIDKGAPNCSAQRHPALTYNWHSLHVARPICMLAKQWGTWSQP